MGETYLPSYKRADNPPPMRMTERDRQIIMAVYRYRLLSSPQVEALFFRSNKPRGRQTSCQRRLQLLFHHGFLDRLKMPIVMGEGREPFIYVLDSLGADFIASMLDVDRNDVGWRPKDKQLGFRFVKHTLSVSEARVAFSVLAQQGRLQQLDWVGEQVLRSASMMDKVPFRMQGARKKRVYPDGYFNVVTPDINRHAHFFVEVDQGTMKTTDWIGKIKGYQLFRQSGFSQRHFDTQNFRVLTIAPSLKRLKLLKRATEKARGEHYFWFAEEKHIDIWQPEQILDSVWTVAGTDKLNSLFA